MAWRSPRCTSFPVLSRRAVVAYALFLSCSVAHAQLFKGPHHSSIYVHALLDQYSRSYAPLSPYAVSLVGALRSMDAALIESTAPILHAIGGNRTVPVHPIGFAIPPEYVRAVVPAKGQGLVTVIPGDPTTYKFLPRPNMSSAELVSLEREYYADMERSLFGLTWKKAGWDCLRHLELLAAGCLPLFTDIGSAPRGAVAFLPKTLMAALLRFPGIESLSGLPGLPSPTGNRNVTINMPGIDPVLYSLTVTAMLDYTRRHLTTPAMAEHMLAVMGLRAPFCRGGKDDSTPHEIVTTLRTFTRRRWRSSKPLHQADSAICPHGRVRVLYLSRSVAGADYMGDTLAHGLVSLLGSDAVTQYPRRDVLYTTPSLLFEEQRAPVRTGHYGAGFSYANLLFDLADAADPSLAAASTESAVESSLRASIAAREFDVVVFGLVHRGPSPLMEAVCASYHPSQVAAVHGNDFPPSAQEVETYASCAGYYFAREAWHVNK